MAAAIPAIVAVGASAAGSYFQGKSQEKANKATSESYLKAAQMNADLWREAMGMNYDRYMEYLNKLGPMYPTREEIKTLKRQYTGQLGQARQGSYGNLFNEMATRGFGSGSGMTGQRAQGIEKGYSEGLSDLYNQLIQYKGKPKFMLPAPPYGFPGQPYQGTTSQPTSTFGGGAMDALSAGAGFYSMMQMLNGMGSGGGGMLPGANWSNPSQWDLLTSGMSPQTY